MAFLFAAFGESWHIRISGLFFLIYFDQVLSSFLIIEIPVRPVQLPAGLGAVACILPAPDLLQHLGASARADSTSRTSESIFSDRSWEVRRSSRGHDDIGNM